MKVFKRSNRRLHVNSLRIPKNYFATFSSSFDLKHYAQLEKNSASVLEEMFPKKLANSEEMQNYFKISSLSPNIKLKGNIQSYSTTNGILLPCWDLLQRGGKRWRPILGIIISKYFDINTENIEENKLLYKFIYLGEIIHNASLILDDVEDKSLTRRNEPCTYLKYGEDIAVNAGVAMMFFPMHNLIQSIPNLESRLRLLEAYFQEMTAIHLGQGWDIEMTLKDNKQIPSEENYMDMVMFKTGVCPRLIVKLIKVYIVNILQRNEEECREVFDDLVKVADLLSIVFQIKDDLLNITDSPLAKSKNMLGEDIYAGKLTLPVLHTLNKINFKEKERLKEILLMKTNSTELIKEAIGILHLSGGIDHTNKIVDENMKTVKIICDKLGKKEHSGSKYAEDILGLANYLIEREN